MATGSSFDGNGQQRAAWGLLRRASRGARRIEFLRDAAEVILDFTEADRVELWLEDGELRYHWWTERRPRADCGFENLDTPWGPGSASPPRQPILSTAMALCCPDGFPVEQVHKTRHGSLWTGVVPGGPAVRALVPFTIDPRNHGALALVGGLPDPIDSERMEQVDALARVLGVAVANRRAAAALTERVKELDCLYGIARVGQAQELELDGALARIVELLPPAWQYPEAASARIVLDEREVASKGFVEGPRCLSADIVTRGGVRGRVEVFYAERGEAADEVRLLAQNPFLEEERHLIAAVAREVALLVERHQADRERAALQEQVRHADRLATIGRLAAGVAHELNEPLANILGFAQLALRSPDVGVQPRADLDQIVRASLYAREVIKKLMLFARQTPPRRAALDLNQVVEEGLALLSPRCAKEGITVVTALATGLPEVVGDPGQLQQVVVNLAMNAIQAMPGGGTLSLGTRPADDAVELVIEDGGVGMTPELVQRIFVPFFTTKDVGSGTGLGLSVVHGIVTSHGGTITVQSAPDRGTRFVVSLPLVASATEGPVDDP